MAAKLFTVDARCARCYKKTECLVRVDRIARGGDYYPVLR